MMKGKKEKKREQKTGWVELIGKEPSKDKAVGKESAFREDQTRKEAWPQHRVR
jgi:hypothetical protein